MDKSPLLKELPGIEHGFYTALDSHQVSDPILMNQVHSAQVVFLTRRPSIPVEADALVTKIPGLNLTVKTADCAPVLLADPEARVIAAVHAGWKGAFQGVIEVAVLKMIEAGAHISQIIASIGPHLQKESFEVSTDMRCLFPVTDNRFFEENKGHILFDFHAYILSRLQQIGIRHIDGILKDTYKDPIYYSYRRDAQNPQRQYSSIMLI